MVLITQLSRQVAGEVQERGREYFTSGAVQILEGDARSVFALVQGSHKYEVNLSCKKNTIIVGCSCPYFESNVEPCKHIWATLLAAEDQGYLQASGRQSHVRLEVDQDYLSEEEDYAGSRNEWNDDYEDWADPDDDTGYPLAFQAPQGYPKRPTASAKN